jgi:drug/metabolite transporter (DMT)-like permease
MIYGALVLALFCLATGRAFVFDASVAYVVSLLYLAIIGSVIAFLVYYTLARRRGYAMASYVSAVVPLVAMLVSSALEAKTWGPLALSGVALVLAGQWLLLRTRRAP